MIPALTQAATDPALQVRARTLQVYLFLCGELDPVEFRPVKRAYVARRLKMRREKVTAQLRWLVARGYLVLGGRESNGVHTYRLAYSVGPGVPPTAPPRVA